MTEIPRTLKTFGGLPIQPAKMGDIVEGRPGTMVVRQAYADGSVRGNCEGREHVFDAGSFEVISKCLPDVPPFNHNAPLNPEFLGAAKAMAGEDY